MAKINFFWTWMSTKRDGFSVTLVMNSNALIVTKKYVSWFLSKFENIAFWKEIFVLLVNSKVSKNKLKLIWFSSQILKITIFCKINRDGFSVMSKLGAKSHQYRSVTVLALWTISSYNLGITFTDSRTFKCFFCILFLLTSMSEKGWFWPSYVYAFLFFPRFFINNENYHWT